MILPSSIQPDVELCDFLKGKIRVGLTGGGSKTVAVYSDWDRPTNNPPDDFISVYINGDIQSTGLKTDYANGYIIASLYCKMKSDGSVKKERIAKILAQFDTLVEGLRTKHYFFRYEHDRFLTPTTPNINSGYSITSLNLKWHTNN